MRKVGEFLARVGFVILLSIGVFMFGIVFVVVIAAIIPLLPLLLLYSGGKYVYQKITKKQSL